jgi:hypothetical protein
MASALERVSRLASPRQELAQYLAELFPDRFFVACESCGQQVVPGFACKQCGTEAPIEISLVTDHTQEIEAEPPPISLEAQPFPQAPLPAPVPVSQRPLRRQRRRRSDRMRPYHFLAVGVVCALVGMSVGLSWRKPVRLIASLPHALPPVELPSLEQIEIQPAPPEPAPPPPEPKVEPVVAAPIAPPPKPPAAPPPRRREPNKRQARVVHPGRFEPSIAPAIVPVSLPPPQAAPKVKVKDGRILDPFGGGR